MPEQLVLEQDSCHSAACPSLAVFQYRTLHTGVGMYRCLRFFTMSVRATHTLWNLKLDV